MATRPLPEVAEFRYASYIAELREFFTTSRVTFGSPENFHAVVDHLAETGSFSDDLSSLVRSIVLREGGAMPHAQLLEILAEAIAGPAMKDSPQNYQQPLRELLAFVAGVMRRPWNVPPSEPAIILPFPSEGVAGNAPSPSHVNQILTADSAHPDDEQTPPVSRQPAAFASAIGTALADRLLEPHPAAMSPLHSPFHSDAEPSPVTTVHEALPARPSRRFPLRIALTAIAATVALAGILAWHAQQTNDVFRIQPVPHAAAATSGTPAPEPKHRVTQSANPTPTPTKPLAAQVLTLSSVSANNTLTTQTVQTAQPALPAQAYPTPLPLPSSSVVHPEYASPQVPPQIRHPDDHNPDNYIVGERPSRAASQSAVTRPSRFAVSSGVMAANLISAPDPYYPKLARLAGIHGQVIIQAVVARDGTISSTHVLRGHRLLRGAAQDAVHRWRYRPYRIDGQPVDVATIITVDFRDPS